MQNERSAVTATRQLLAKAIRLGDLAVCPYPSVALRVRKLMAQGEYKLTDLANLMREDPSLFATLLRVANSPYYRRNESVNTIERAISLIGTQEAGRIALASSLGSFATGAGALAGVRRVVWSKALISALVGNYLAYLRGQNADEAFTCGMLHDFGTLVALATMEKQLTNHPNFERLTEEEWLNVAESVHIDVGVAVAKSWNLSPLLQECIRYHHNPAAAPTRPAMVEVMAAADEVSSLMQDCPYLLPRDLMDLPSIRSLQEAERMMETIPLIPSFVQSASTAPDSVEPTAEFVVRPDSVLPGSRVEKSMPIKWVQNNDAYDCNAVFFCDEGLAVQGKMHFPQGGVARFEIPHEGSQEFQVSGRVVLVRPCDEGNIAEVKLFAMPGQGRVAWQAFLAELRQGAAT